MRTTFVEDRAQIIFIVTDLSAPKSEVEIVGSRFGYASIIFAGASAPPNYTEEKSGADVPRPLIIPRAASWGRSLGVLDVHLSPSGGIISYKLQYVDLNDSVENDPMLARMTEDYLADIAKAPTGVPEIRHVGYTGSDSCRDCHGGQYEHWTETRHARAWTTLEEIGRTREATCIPCHVTGFTGLESIPERMVPYGFRGVGCESCHGPGENHIRYQTWKIGGLLLGEPISEDFEDPIVRIPPESTCTVCHRPPNDEGFVYRLKLDRIRHD
ncbi:MAG TPA: hypothetical protein ENN67_04790 [Firmicutes bacterium]|nr:hypothetical protein [Bacillota bacterium]